MKSPHFRKFSKGAKDSVPQVGSEVAAQSYAEDEAGEIVIRADRIFLGSSDAHRLRVVCYETPSDSIAARL